MKNREYKIIHRIAQRGATTLAGCPYLDIALDIYFMHISCGGLRLKELLEADDMNFIHDIVGIRKNLNRDTKKLENCFVPRYAKPEGD